MSSPDMPACGNGECTGCERTPAAAECEKAWVGPWRMVGPWWVRNWKWVRHWRWGADADYSPPHLDAIFIGSAPEIPR